MFEKQQPFEKRESLGQTPRPNLLDVVKVDDRWAQVVGDTSIKYLDDQSQVRINWDDYLCQIFDRYKEASVTNIWVSDLLEKNQISHDEYMAIHWGSKEKEDPNFRNYVTVFGIFTRKK